MRDTDKEATFKAVECVRDGDADILMKGFIQTSDLLREVVNRDTGIRNRRFYHMLLWLRFHIWNVCL
ncbi:hypothetical protein MGH68_06750 [Erysipelothrix sp. D19-032]